MRRFLYKYMPMRADFFKNLMIRATPAFALNDPFEAAFNEIQVQEADENHRSFYNKHGECVFDRDKSWLADTLEQIRLDMADIGIVSFTEDFNNLLMWAHYADNHKGFVVEFDFNEPFFADSLQNIGGRASRFGPNYLGDVFEFPENVNYRQKMPRFERPELSAPDSKNEFHWKKFKKCILYTKSNDWIYEKEQRSVVRLRDADSIICKDSDYIRSACNRDSRISLSEQDGGKVQITFPNEYEMHEDMGDESLKFEVYHRSHCEGGDNIHLFRVNPAAISGVYFGCRAEFTEALSSIKNNPSLQRLKIFHMEKDGYLYHLNERQATR